MRQMLKDLNRRIVKLEQRLWPQIPRGVVLAEQLDDTAIAGMAEDDVIVEDTYENAEGRVIKTRERITKDPDDCGTRFRYDSWDCLSFERSYNPLAKIRLTWSRADRRRPRPMDAKSIEESIRENPAEVDEPETPGLAGEAS